MLGFRSLFRTRDTPELLDVAAAQLYGWLKGKGYDAERAQVGRTNEIANGVVATIQRLKDEIGSETMRAQIIESTPSGSWTSELTVYSSPTGNRGWVWLDILKPDDHNWTATPRLARSLVSVLPARDGAHLLNSFPQRVEAVDVQEVVDALTDTTRRGLAFVAGTGHLTRFIPWQQTVTELLRDAVGLANAWVLTPDATDRFNFLTGRSHEATPGFVRTYLPRVSLDDPLDTLRHRFLTGSSIERETGGALRRVLGHRAREQMISARLPDFLRDLDRILRGELDSDLLAQFDRTAGAVAPIPRMAVAIPDLAEPEIQPEKEELTKTDTEFDDLPAAESGLLEAPSQVDNALRILLRELTGTDRLTLESLAHLGEMARAAQRAEATRDQIRLRLEQLRSGLEEVELERDIAHEALAAEQQERAAAEEERADAERRLRYLQKELATSARADLAWSHALDDIDIRDIRPDSFVELLSRENELVYVDFTGDITVVQGLDKHGPARAWAGKVWDALLALDDYARLRMTQSYDRDIAGYLTTLPSGCHGFSANRYASNESDDVQRNPKFRKPRELPVPTALDPAGRIFMGAHFKIAQYSMISPRVHCLDATASTGRVYVGYIGPHLPTSAS